MATTNVGTASIESRTCVELISNAGKTYTDDGVLTAATTVRVLFPFAFGVVEIQLWGVWSMMES